METVDPSVESIIILKILEPNIKIIPENSNIFEYGHAGNPVNNNTLVYKNGVTLLNNNCHAGGRTNDQSRQIQYINGDEEFIVYYTVNDPPNTSKHIYVMDIASGSYYVPGLPGTASYQTHGVKILLSGGTGINHDTFIPPSWTHK